MSMQSEDPWFDLPIIKDVQARLKKTFAYSGLYLAFIPMYPSGMWSFSCASKKYDISVIRNKKSKIVAPGCGKIGIK